MDTENISVFAYKLKHKGRKFPSDFYFMGNTNVLYQNSSFQMAIKQFHSSYWPQNLCLGITLFEKSKSEVKFCVGST